MRVRRVVRSVVCLLLSLIIVGIHITWLPQSANHSGLAGRLQVEFGSIAHAADADFAKQQIVAGGSHSLMLMADGTVKAWGYNNYGQLGLGHYSQMSTPTTILGLTGVVQLVAGGSFSLALLADGSVKSWGCNNNGQLGLGHYSPTCTPATISGLTGVKQLVAGSAHVLALMTDGSVKAWGHNGYYQLGVGSSGDKPSPTNVPNLAGVRQLASGGYHSLALMADHTVTAWGYNGNGQLGVNDYSDRAQPTPIPNTTGVAQLAAGSAHSLALLDDGTVKAWGHNSYGQLGVGTTMQQLAPSNILGLDHVARLAATGMSSFALLSDGTARAWGYNYYGQLGLGNTDNRNVPTAISSLDRVVQLAPGGDYALAILADGSVKAWGYNNSGQLGLGNYSNQLLPVEVLALRFNFAPEVHISFPLTDQLIGLNGGFVPLLSVGDRNGDELTCRIYLNDAAAPLESKNATNTKLTQTLQFSPVRAAELPEGVNTLRCEVSDGGNQVSASVDFIIVKHGPAADATNITTSASSITVSAGLTTGTPLHDLPYRYTIGSYQTAWLSQSSYTRSGLLPNTSYHVMLEIRDSLGNIAEQSNDVRTKAAPPGLSVAGVTSTAATLALSGQNPLNTEFSVQCNGLYVSAAGLLVTDARWITVSGNQLAVGGLLPGTLYHFAARARNADGSETESGAELTVITQQSLANIQRVQASTGTTVSWPATAGAKSYDLEVDGVVVNVGNKTSYSHVGLNPKTQHAYRLRARLDGSVGPWSEFLVASTNNQAPAGSTSITAQASNTSITLVWAEVQDAQGYDLEVDGVEMDNGCLPHCTLSGLAPSTSHTFRVRPRNSAGIGAWSSSLTVTTYLLDTPANLVAHETESSISLSWDQVPMASGYQVQIDDDPVVSGGSEPTYTKSDLDPETMHTFRVKAVSASGESGWTQPLSLFTLPEKPATPQDIRAIASPDTISITWNEVSGAIGYDVELDGVMVENGLLTQYAHEDLDPYSEHIYRVRSRSAAMYGDWSEPLAVLTLPGRPLPPQDVRFLTTSTLVEISWQEEPGAIGYDIEVNGEEVSVGTRTSYIHRRLEPNREYAYRLRTRNVLGVSDWSGYIVNNSTLAQCKKGKSLDLGLGASNIVDFNRYVLSVTYRPDVVEVADLSLLTAEREVTIGRIAGTDIVITEFEPGHVVFVVEKVIDPGFSWTGVINSIQFKAKVSGGTTITYTVFCDPEEME